MQAELKYGAPKTMCFPGQLCSSLAAVRMRRGRGRMRVSVLSVTGTIKRALLLP